VPIELDRIRDADEAYWTRYRGAPKAFVSPEDGHEMWQNPYGMATSVRASRIESKDWEKRLPRAVEPEAVGIRVLPVAQAARASASPTTDFGGLFMGLGGLLVIAALVLVVLLLRLGLTQRAGEAEALRVMGFRASQIRAIRLSEGSLAVAAGAALGLIGGLWVARWTLDALASVWEGALGGMALIFDATHSSLASGAGATLAVGLGVLVWAGRTGVERPSLASPRLPAAVSLLALLGASAILASAGDNPAGAYFGAGGLMLVAGLAALTTALRVGPPKAAGTLTALAWANLARRPRAAVAATAVLAVGTFVVVGVGVSRHDPAAMAARGSGTGGFELVGESTLPVVHALDTPEGLAAYGLSPDDLPGVTIVPMRVREGDDASCLNLAQAPRPTLYGVNPRALEAHGTFSPEVWSRLSSAPSSPGLLPAIGDQATLTWRLKLGVGDELLDVDEASRPIRLRIADVLPTSILQGGLIVDGPTLAERYPTTSADRLFLIDTPPDQAAEVAALLTDALADTGFVATPATEVLGSYLRVENTYLAIFLALGGLGLLLGAPGVGVLLFRQVLTRRRELAVLVAMGWRRGRVRRLVALEHGAIVVFGVGIGGASAALAVVPALGSSVSRSPAEAALVLVGCVALVGLVGVGLATRLALRGRLVDALSDGA